MTINNPQVELVIAVLNSIDVDGETMEYIIEKTNMTDQMKSQLGVTSQMPDDVLFQIAEDIMTDLSDEGVELLEDQTYGINANEIYLEDVTFDKYTMNKIIRSVLDSHFVSIE